jgi:hypothetical protein
VQLNTLGLEEVVSVGIDNKQSDLLLSDESLIDALGDLLLVLVLDIHAVAFDDAIGLEERARVRRRVAFDAHYHVRIRGRLVRFELLLS